MRAAMKAVVEGLSSINKAALDHNVSITTLKDWLSGHVEHGVNPGPRAYLENEEAELASLNTMLPLGMENYTNILCLLLGQQ